MNMALFGTNGVRGKLDALTPSLAFDLASSFSSWCPQGPIMVGRDMRLTSPMLHSSVKSAIMASGRGVLDLGLCSSPVAEYSHMKAGSSGLIIITASHNAPEWNALKFVDSDGRALSWERGAPIEKMALAKSYFLAPYDKVGSCKKIPSPSAAHASAALSFVNCEKIRKRKLRVALDFGNGTSSLSLPIFQGLGCEIIALNEKLDGTFQGRPSEPSEKNVQGLLSAVKKNSCDLGVAWDGDSDRVVFVDEKGKWIVGDKGFGISASHACREEKKRKDKLIVTTVATSRCVEEACSELGAKTIYTAVGAPYLSEKMRELGPSAISGGEEVGGIIWPRFSPAKDGILSAAKVCEMLCDEKLSELVSELPLYFNSKSIVEVQAGRKQGCLSAAKKLAQGMGGKLTEVDGIRVDLEEGWAIVRASGTENVMRIFAESKSQKRADSLAAEFTKAVKGAQ
jgi:phosphomannomutase/phosphoglucomutase